MPIGAENIGTAYVRVIADGKDFDLADMFEGHEGDADKGGRRLSQAYQKGFIEEWQKAPNRTKLQNALRDSLIKGDSAKMFTATKQWQQFRDGLVKEYGEIGRRAGDNLEKELIGGLDVSQLQGRLKNLRRDLAKAETELNREAFAERENDWKRHLAHIAALEEDAARDRRATAMLDTAYRLNRLFDMRKEVEAQRELAFLTRAFRENEQRDVKRLAALYRETRSEIELMQQGERRHSLTRKELLDNLKQVRAEMERNGSLTRAMSVDIDRHRDALLRMNPELNVYRRNLVGVADATGTAFGRGSRNNFLNFMGSVARATILAGAGLIDLAGYFTGLTRRMRDAGSFAGAFAVGAREIAKGGAIAVGGLAGLFGIIGPLLSILSQLGGIMLALAASMGGALLGAISALSSTLAFGLGGGLAIAATGIVPLVAGIGVLTLAIKNADKDTKASIKSITDEFSGLGEVASRSTFANIDEQATRFKRVLGDLAPLVRNIGTALSRVGDNWLDMLESKGYRDFRRALEDYLPGAVESLGNALGNALGGLAGMFRAAIPESQNFLGWLDRITERFNGWANSARGQSELATFFRRASDSAAELGGFMLALTGLFAELFDQANQPGNGLFASMADGLERWTKVLDDNPDIMRGWMDSMEAFGEFTGSVRDLLLELLSAGQQVGDSLFSTMSSAIDGWVTTLRNNPDILRNWYDSAQDFAGAIGNVAVGFGKVFDALDNDFSRGVITGVFETLAGAIELVSGALETVASMFGSADGAVLTFTGTLAGAVIGIGILQKALGGAALTGSLSTLVTNLRDAEKRMSALGGIARTAAGAGGLLAFYEGTKQSNDAAGILLQTLGGAGAGFALGGPWGALIGGAAGAAMAIFGRETEEAGSNVRNAQQDFATMASTLDQITGAARQATREMVLQEAAQSGVIGQARNFGITARDLVSASLGFEGAQARVNAALERGKTFTVAYRDEFGGLNTMQVRTKAQLDELTASLEAQGYEIDNVRKSAIDLAGADAIRKFVGENAANWGSLTQKVRENYLATQDLSGLYGKLPAKKVTKIDAEGVPPTISGVAKVAAKYDLLPKQVETLLQVMGVDLSVRDILKLQRELDETDRKRPRPKIDVDKSAADKGITGLKGDLDFVGRMHKVPKVSVDAGAALGTLGNVRAGIDSIRDKTVTIRVNTIRTGPGGQGDGYAPTANGGTFYNAQRRLIGEAGPEAVVPLARNLNLVDPSVRWLSAIAQGKMMVNGTPPKTISADGWTIISNSPDPEVVAREAFDRLAGAGY